MRYDDFLPGPRLILAAVVAALAAAPATATELYNEDGRELSVDGMAMLGLFHSERNYNLLGTRESGGSTWQEGYVDAGLRGSLATGSGASLYGRASALASGTFGDGDAGGFTSGDERRVAVEDAFVGWRSGGLFPGLGEDGFDISAGRQALTLGDGFLIAGDALNLGDALDELAGTNFDRGGAYWLAARKAFDKTAVLRLGGQTGLRSDIFWLESDNAAQADMELAGINAELVHDAGTLGVAYIEGLGVDAESAQILDLTHRDGLETWSVRGQGNAGVENLFLSAEFVDQTPGDTSRGDANAWYLEAGWTFAEAPWSPTVAYRFSTFEEDFDPLFFGFTRGYGTWFQGEVAGNFAGPFNADTDVHHLRVEAAPMETLMVGMGLFDFRDTAGGTGALDARELNVYAEWVAADNLIITPLIGFYRPDNSEAEGGSQIGRRATNVYSHIVFIVPF
jgi:hypothetical protein